MAIAVVGRDHVQFPARAPDLRGPEGRKAGVAILVGTVSQAELHAEAEEIELLEADRGPVAATTAAKLQGRAQTPDIAGAHFDDHLAAFHPHRADPGVEEGAAAAQQALGLGHGLFGVRIADLEQQQPLDRAFARLHMPAIGQTVEKTVLFGLLQIEDIAGIDADFTDDGAFGLQLLAIELGGLQATAGQDAEQQSKELTAELDFIGHRLLRPEGCFEWVRRGAWRRCQRLRWLPGSS